MQFQPISGSGYHDWHLVGIDLPEGVIRLRLRSDDDKAAIEFHGVVLFLGSDFLSGNIVLEITKGIVTDENLEYVLNDLLSFNSQYFTEYEANYYRKSREILNFDYVAVTSSYGARIAVICKAVAEFP